MAMRDIHLGVRLPFETAEQRNDSEDVLIRLLGVVCKTNLQYLRRNPDTPLLYDTDIVYTEPDQLVDRRGVTPERKLKLVKVAREMGLSPEEAAMQLRIAEGVEVFLDIPNLQRRGKGDCNELVPWRVAECWRAGVMASPYLTKERNERGGWTYHAVIWYPQEDEIECPSTILGMHGPSNALARCDEIGKNVTRTRLYSQVIGSSVIDAGFVPRSGTFKSPYGARSLVGRRAA